MSSSHWRAQRAITHAQADIHEYPRAQRRIAGDIAAFASRQPRTNFPALRALVLSKDARKLENAVKLGKSVLPGLAECLDEADPDDFVKEKQATIRSLLETSSKKYTLGVVGATGHGKSSLINAVLDEDELVPTSSCQACTAVAIEISWNDHTTTTCDYFAEIEFITFSEWKAEFDKLIGDLPTANDGEEEVKSEAKLAMDKIRTVFPAFDFENLIESIASVSDHELHDLTFLGTTKTEEASNASELLEKMSQYFESEPSSLHDNGTGDAVALWPFIKVVRLQTRAEILFNGLVLVDLPGVADANTARSNVAANYLKKCDAVWVVADITRAADDRATHKLLGNSFKQQMRLDGNYGNITMVCTKADNLNIDRDGRQFNYPEDKTLYAKARLAVKAWRTRYKRSTESMSARLNALRQILVEVAERREAYRIKSEIAGNDPEPDKKRKRAPDNSTGGDKKRARSVATVSWQTESNTVSSDQSYRAAQDIWDQLGNGPRTQMATGECFSTSHHRMFDHFDFIESLARDESESISEELMENQRLDLNCQHLRSKLKSLYMSERNQKAIAGARQQFKTGLKEMDEPLTQETTLAQPDQESRERHYQALADALPVFCVSSTAYQDFLDPLQSQIEGFGDREATQIPQLRRHAVTLTEKGRVRHCQQFLNKMIELLNSLRMWESADNSQRARELGQEQSWQAAKQSNMEILTRHLFTTIDRFVTQCEDLLEGRLFLNMEASLRAAENMALSTASKWSSLHHKTYQAVCRRDGEFSNHKGLHDFNEDLISPFKRRISSDWEQAFVRLIPNYLEALQKEAAKAQQDFHEELEKSLPCSVPREKVEGLRAQLQTRKYQLDFTAQSLMDSLTQSQREANRQFKPPIQQSMAHTYCEAAQQNGRGSFGRMQRIISGDLSWKRGLMFPAVGQNIRQQLSTLQASLKKDIVAQIKDTLKSIDHDYSFLVGASEKSSKKAAKDAATRKHMRSLLARVEGHFQEA